MRRREVCQPQRGTRDQYGRMHSNTLAERGIVTKASDVSVPVTWRKKRGYGKRADEEQLLTSQRHGPRTRPAFRGAASVDCVTRTARGIGTAIPDARATAHGRARLRRKPPAQKERNKTGAQNRPARTAKQPRSPKPCSKHIARKPTAARSPRSWLNREFALPWQEHPGQLPSPPRCQH